MDHPLDSCLGSDVGTVSREGLGENTAGESHDAPAIRNMLCRLREYKEGSAQVGRDHLVEGGHVSAGNRKERHDARTVNHHIGSTEGVNRLFENALHVFGICHICLHSDALSACSLEICDNCLCWGRFSRVVHDHGKSIFSQSFCNRASDSTRGAGDNRNLFHDVLLLSRWLSSLYPYRQEAICSLPKDNSNA